MEYGPAMRSVRNRAAPDLDSAARHAEAVKMRCSAGLSPQDFT